MADQQAPRGASQDWLKIANYLSTGLTEYNQGMAASAGYRSEASQNKSNIKRRLLQGDRQAADIRQKGRQVASDATVAMVAQGGVVDDSMLAKIKRQANIDAIGAMYDAKADASTMQYAADLNRIQARQARHAAQVALGANLLRAGSTYNW